MGLFDRLKKKNKHRQRVLVIGLDGVPYPLVVDLCQKGCMPNLSKLMQQGVACKMESSMPPVSSVAWTTFMTGVNPAKHGIFGFMERRQDSYAVYFPNSSHIQTPTLWDILSREGKKTIALNIPQTYPARETNGIVIAGFVALVLEKAVYPPRLLPKLNEMDYRIDVNYLEAAEKKDEFFKDLFYTLQKRREAFHYLMDREPWDLFIGVFTGTDRLHHFFWGDYEDPQSGYHHLFLKYYAAIDNIIAEMVANVPEETPLIIMADHGFALLKKEVYLNAWLKEEGLLKLKKDPPQSFDDIDPDSKAFVLDPSRVYINLKGAMPQGCVEPGAEYENLVATISEGFLSLKDGADSGPIISRVFKKEELYAGPLMVKAPDLVLWSTPGYDLKGSITKDELLGRGKFTGMHTFDDALLYLRGQTILKSKPHIQDVAPTILKFLEVPIPEHMNGTALI